LYPTSNLEDQVPVLMSPSDSVAQLYPQALGSLFITFYDLAVYSGGFLTLLHTRNDIIIGTLISFQCKF
jgi:hypothetical protein